MNIDFADGLVVAFATLSFVIAVSEARPFKWLSDFLNKHNGLSWVFFGLSLAVLVFSYVAFSWSRPVVWALASSYLVLRLAQLVNFTGMAVNASYHPELDLPAKESDDGGHDDL